MLTKSLRPKARPASLDTSAVTPANASPDNVAKIATTRADIPRSGPMLIGVFGKEDSPKALIRLPSGKVHEVTRGDRLGTDMVLAIAADEVILKGGSATTRLSLPRG